MPNQQPVKSDTRNRMRAQRRSLDHAQRNLASQRVMQKVRAQRLITAGQRVALYIPWDGELDTMPLISYAWKMGASVWLPVAPVPPRKRMQFAPLRPSATLVPDRYGIPIPKCPRSKLISAHQLDLLILPLVAFDRAGYRLGMGAGYYDATLDFLRQRRIWKHPQVVGAGYSFQEIAALPRSPWDVPMHGIVTDIEFIPVETRQ